MFEIVEMTVEIQKESKNSAGFKEMYTPHCTWEDRRT